MVDQNSALLLLPRRRGDRLTGWDRAEALSVARSALGVAQCAEPSGRRGWRGLR